jgi:hypothetical protein
MLLRILRASVVNGGGLDIDDDIVVVWADFVEPDSVVDGNDCDIHQVVQILLHLVYVD